MAKTKQSKDPRVSVAIDRGTHEAVVAYANAQKLRPTIRDIINLAVAEFLERSDARAKRSAAR